MRFSIVLAVLMLSLLAIGTTGWTAPEQDDVRGAFLTSRPKEKSEAPPARPTHRRTRPSPTPRKTDKTPAPTPTPLQSPSPGSIDPKKVNAGRLGLGLTLFMRDANGLAVRVDPSHVFTKGDRVRVLLETNTDGYLYIFNTTDDGPPVMLYPDPQLDEAGNYLQAHVPFEIPSSMADQERLRWLVFDEHAGAERLYFVFTREPLAGVPIEDELINACRDANPPCPWKPATAVWAQVRLQMNEPVHVDKAKKYDRPQTESEHQATTPGLGLSKSDPEPSLVMMVASSNSATLVTSLDLIHR